MSASIEAVTNAAHERVGFRKSIKFALTRLLGGSLEQLMFHWRRISMRVNVWLCRP